MLTYCFWRFTILVLIHHGAVAWPAGLSNRNLTIAGEYWDPFFVIEENSDGTETYRVVNQTLCQTLLA